MEHCLHDGGIQTLLICLGTTCLGIGYIAGAITGELAQEKEDGSQD